MFASIAPMLGTLLIITYALIVLSCLMDIIDRYRR